MFFVEHLDQKYKVYFKHVRRTPNSFIKKLENDLLEYVNHIFVSENFSNPFKKVTLTESHTDEYTECIIEKVNKKNLKTLVVFGESKCSVEDNYSKEYGRQLSLLRAVETIYDFENKELSSLIIKEYMKFAKIREKYNFSEKENELWNKIIKY